jgi:ACS family hexuronate transporter-like MFS transporter
VLAAQFGFLPGTLWILIGATLGGMAGSIGGMLIALAVGEILQKTGSYALIFVVSASSYLVALLVIQLLAPRLDPVRL